ncbi:uncharacterized protein PV06_05911 [Exophiala oligosperma]|uniref:Probable quinone oxidoreductase n=2 Tax=Chaetothyriales TaxID=34395 RepID=A0A0D2DIR8_9EURO|nr:uncharacterized protein PV06_05911 [Exophiala oligosperma]KAJ9627572.1 hypothetical protein H2204_009611 [Knufia peltigerae]KIW42350.1 hypothetical protein PV06_05911 [Exophiala oligosperma]
MKAVVLAEIGASHVLKVEDDRLAPEPAANEVCVEIEYAGINFVDVYQRTGLYALELPAVAGREGAGVVRKVGDTAAQETDVKVGDKVAVFAQGAYAQYVCAEATHVLKLGRDISTKLGAAMMLQGLTAWTLVRDAHEVQRGEWVLVRAAAGGTGGLVSQMAKHLGAQVIGTASTPGKCSIAKANGCDFVINHEETNVEAEVLRLTDQLGCHAVFSGVGRATFGADLNCTRRKGTLVTYGNSSGPIEAFRPLQLSGKNLKLVRPTLANYIKDRGEFDLRSAELVNLVSTGAVKVNIGKVYGMDEVGKAQDELSQGLTTGKLLVRIS